MSYKSSYTGIQVDSGIKAGNDAAAVNGVVGCNGSGTFSSVLGNVTNDAQTKASIVPNTAPSTGQILVGNAGGTAFAPVSMSSHATLSSTGAITIANGVVTPTKLSTGAPAWDTKSSAYTTSKDYGSTSANTDYDFAITPGIYLFTLCTSGVYHVNMTGIVHFYDSADLGAVKLLTTDYTTTTISLSVVYVSPGNAVIRWNSNRAYGGGATGKILLLNSN